MFSRRECLGALNFDENDEILKWLKSVWNETLQAREIVALGIQENPAYGIRGLHCKIRLEYKIKMKRDTVNDLMADIDFPGLLLIYY